MKGQLEEDSVMYLAVSFALIAVFKSVRILAINGGAPEVAVELYRTDRSPNRAENLRGVNIVGKRAVRKSKESGEWKWHKRIIITITRIQSIVQVLNGMLNRDAARLWGESESSKGGRSLAGGTRPRITWSVHKFVSTAPRPQSVLFGASLAGLS